MPLAAAQVIDTIAARLVPVALSGGRVFTSRSWPITEAELPAWRVVAEDEPVEPQYLAPVVNEHTLIVRCEGVVRAVADLDDAMHALAAQGMAALFSDPVPHQLQLTGIDRRLSTEGEYATGSITVSLTAKYMVDQAQPETIL